MPAATPPCRLSLILAREAPRAVILRRGPSDYYRLSLWHTDSDTFEHGQWFKGRIYEERCDLSPDGRLFIYFAMKSRGYRRRVAQGYSWSWTAISKPPYLTALALWNMQDTWLGGGLFLDGRTVWLNSYPGHHMQPNPRHLPPKWLRIQPNTTLVAGDKGVAPRRWARDGWQFQLPQGMDSPDWSTAWRLAMFQQVPFVWHKPGPAGRYTLTMEWSITNYKSEYIYMLMDSASGQETWLEDVTCADWDQRGRLVATRAGQVQVLVPTQPNADYTILADLNAQRFEPIIAPAWGTQW